MAEAGRVFPGTGPTISQLEMFGMNLQRYGLALLLVLIGSYKFFAFEADAIQPLVGSSPLLAWLYGILDVRSTAAVFGLFEIMIGLLIATRHWMPRVSGSASLAAAGMFLVTLSFLVTTPGALMPANPFHQFLLKDVVLLGAALFTAADARQAAIAPGQPLPPIQDGESR
jgi:uncharacterized membrane protein YkgB